MSLLAKSPYRQIDWRWERAAALHREGQPPGRKQEDPWVHLAYEFQPALASATTRVQREELELGLPDMYWAWQMSKDPDVPESVRAAVEARLLAGQSFEEVGKTVRCSPATIAAYEALFFNVTDRLGDDDWVIHHAFGLEYHRTVTARDFQVLWKVFGYFGGPEALDVYIRKGIRRPARRGEVRAWFQEEARLLTTIQAAVAARTLPVNGFTQMPILELDAENRKLDLAASQLGGGEENEYVKGLSEVLKSVVWRMTEARAVDNLGPAVEPRADELLAIAARGNNFDWSKARIPEVSRATA